NLVANAIDATPQGGQVNLSCRVMFRGGRSGVELRVVDSGEGIAPEYLNRIFEPFFTTKPTGKGTGLGLSIARQAVEACQGTLRAASRVGEGTIMTVWLPTARTPKDEENTP
ncbi:MAG: HAMP domain-containing sensor histidine kinase, partial [Myxococcota bacterium]|nr:HAMP domain-containing sensor histidine kinase [Myxococcota bacterium]